MHDSKSYCTRKMAASQSRTVHSKTHRVGPIHTRNIGPIGPISIIIPSPWIEYLPKGRSDMPCMIQRATVPGNWLHLNQERCIRDPQGLSCPHKKYLTHRSNIKYSTITLNRVLAQKQWLGRSHFPGTAALWIILGISDLPLGKDSIQGDGIVLDNGPMGPIFLVRIG